MKLTRKSALEKSIKLWEYVVENNCSKKDYFIKYPKLKIPHSDCYLCELVFSKYNNCSSCPVKWVKNPTHDLFLCTQLDSPYKKMQIHWEIKTLRNMYAKQVLNLLKKTLNNLKGELK